MTPQTPTETNTAPTTPELEETGGTLSFDSARTLRSAFEAAADPGQPKETPAESGKNSPPEETPAESGKNAGPKETPKAKQPTADDLAQILGAKKESPKDAPTEQDDTPSELKQATEPAQKAFGKLNKAYKEEKRRREELEAKLADIQKTPQNAENSEVAALKKQNEEYERELQVARVEATKEYKEAVVEPMNLIRKNVESFVSKYELNESEILSAFGDSNLDAQAEKLSDLAAGMNDRDRNIFYKMADRWLEIQSVRERVTGNAKLALEKLEALRQQEAQKSSEERTKNYSNAVDSAWKDLSEKVPIFARREGDEDWNAGLDQAYQYSKSLNFDSMADAQKSDVAIRASAATFLYGNLVALYEKYQEAMGALAKYQSAKPGAGGGGSIAAKDDAPQHEDFISAIKAGIS
jgi:hypothetical protein